MIKRLLYISILLAAMLASCTKITQGPEAQELVFSAVASHSVKGIISTTNYPLDEPFAVEAVYIPTPEDGAQSKMFITGETVRYNSDQAVWKTRNEYFWPENGTLLFYAGSPIIPQLTVSADKGVEIDWAAPTVEQTQTDLCFASATENCKSHASAVPIVFSHGLSQICIKARCLENYSYSRKENNLVQANVIKVILDSVKICGIVSKGHFTQEPLRWTTDPSYTADYQVFRSDEGLELGIDRYDNPILNTVGTLLLIPQNLGKKAVIKVWYHVWVRSSVTNADTGQIVSDETYTIPQYSEISLGLYCPNWLMDYKYTFRLAIGMEETQMATAITDWTETKERIIGDE